jgi:hypothetical protein
MLHKNNALYILLVFLSVALLSSTMPAETVVSARHTGPSKDSINQTLASSSCFIENKGQWEDDILFVGDTDFGRVIFREKQIQYQLIQYERNEEKSSFPLLSYQSYSVNLNYPKAKPSTIEGIETTGTLFNYFIGDNPDQWASQCRAFRQITYTNLWEGIDLTYYFIEEGLKYDFILSPDADSSQLKTNIEGTHLLLKEKGTHAQLLTPLGTLMEAPLYTYGTSTHKTYPVSFIDVTPFATSHEDALVPTSDFYTQLQPYLAFSSITSLPSMPKATLSFAGIPPAPRKETLVIDPLIRTTYVGGSKQTDVNALVIDDNDFVYVGGWTMSIDLPKMNSGFQNINPGGGNSSFVSCFSQDLSELCHTTYLGGSGRDSINSICITKENNILVAGNSSSFNFPKTDGGAQARNPSNHESPSGFVALLSSDLSELHQATYFGGMDYDSIRAMKIFDNDQIYIAGTTDSQNIPKTDGGFQERFKESVNHPYSASGFVASISEDLKQIRQSTYLGGSNFDSISNLEITVHGSILIAGGTLSKDFPLTDGTLIPKYHKKAEYIIIMEPYDYGFISILNPELTQLQKSTFIGGTDQGDEIVDLKIHPNGDIYFVGSGSRDFPIASHGFQEEGYHYIASINEDLSQVIHATRFDEWCQYLTISHAGNIFIAGWTMNTNLPMSKGSQNEHLYGRRDAFIAKFSDDLKKLYQATYIGGSDTDIASCIVAKNDQVVYISGGTRSKDIHGRCYGYQKNNPFHGESIYYTKDIRDFIPDTSFISRVYFPTFEEVIIYLQIGTSNADLVKEGKKQTISMDVSPQVIQDRTMVPLRFITEAFGTEVEWIATSKIIRLVKGDTMIVMQIGSRVVYINDRKVTIDASPVIRNSRTLVPVRFIAENIGYKVEWFPHTKEIKVSQ